MVSEVTVRSLKGGYGYYRRDDGTISCDEMGGNAIARHTRDGWVPLQQYGTYNMTYRDVDRPLDNLFRQGGAKELPVSQLIEESYAYPIFGPGKDDYYAVDGVKVEFPQLVGADVPPLKDCPFCPRRGSDAQLANHIEAMHPQQFDIIQRQHAEKKLKQPGPAEIAQTMTSAPRTWPAAPDGDYVCGRCQEGFNHPMALGKHVKSHKEEQE
jgi:hypothetical protein